MHKLLIATTAIVSIFIAEAKAEAPAASPNYRLVHAGTLLAVPGEAVRNHVTIIVKDDRIADIRDGFVDPGAITDAPPENISVVDLSSQYVLPGLIDCHVHTTSQISKDTKLEGVTLSEQDGVARGTLYLARTLYIGFTTVRDAGGDIESVVALRNATHNGYIAGPRMLVAGDPLSPTGGHSDENGYNTRVYGEKLPNICNGVDDCRRAVRHQIKYGADLIKIMATGGVLDDSGAGVDQQFTDDELKAIVDTAHLLGRKVAAHAHGAQGIKAAVRAGVDSIEHGTFLDADGAALMKKNGTYLVPTLIATRFVAEKGTIDGYFPPRVQAKAKLVGSILGQQVQRASAAGVKIAFGTDSAVTAHGFNNQEFALLVKYGLTPVQAIRTATVNAADLLGISGDAGTIAAGKAADLVATAKDPTADVTELEHLTFVMKSGKIYRSVTNPTEATGWLPSVAVPN